MAKVMIAGTEKVAMSKVGDEVMSAEQAKAKADKMNKQAEKLGIETRYEVKG